MKILIIDDKESDIKGIIRRNEELENICIYKNIFEEGLDYLKETNIDLLILDWNRLSDGSDDFFGEKIINQVWNCQFVPVIIFTGRSEAVEDSLEDTGFLKHPMIRLISKGSVEPVMNEIDKIKDIISLIQNIKKDINASFREASRIFDGYINNEDNKIIYKFGHSQKMSNFFEAQIYDSLKKLPAYFQYIYPPIDNSLNICDIIKNKQTDEKYMIFTPSCDMRKNNEKVDNIICAKVIKDNIFPKLIDNYDSLTSQSKKKDKIYNLASKINSGHSNGYIFLPKYKDIIDASIIDYKDIQSIPIKKIYPNAEIECANYERILSIMSPYKERMVSIYSQFSLRYGVMDLDADNFARQYLSYIEGVNNENIGN